MNHIAERGIKMKLEDNCFYKCENGAIVKVIQFSKHLLYKFKALEVEHENNGIKEAGVEEVWSIEGQGIHFDCGWSIIEKI
jgi:hypothetical protein